MKKIYCLLITLVFSLGIVSCSDDENSSNPLVGTWAEKGSYEWFEYTFDKNYTGRLYNHYTDSEGKHLEGAEIEKTITYVLNIEKNG